MSVTLENRFPFLSFSSAEEVLGSSVVFHEFALVSTSSVRRPASLSVTHSRDIYFAQRSFSPWFSPRGQEPRSSAAVPCYFSRDKASHSSAVVTCLTRVFLSPAVFVFFLLRLKKGFTYFLFQVLLCFARCFFCC